MRVVRIVQIAEVHAGIGTGHKAHGITVSWFFGGGTFAHGIVYF